MTDTPNYKPIETIHSGWKFRSRLEARWAVFFETLGIEYRYEPEGFELGDGIRYLPDFYIPHMNSWIEIKPSTPTPDEREKAIRLCIATQQQVTILAGDAWTTVEGFSIASIRYLTREDVDESFVASKIHWLSTEEGVASTRNVLAGFNLSREYGWSTSRWAECDICGHITLLGLGCTPCECNRLGHLQTETPRLIAAYTAARQARFK